MYKTLYHQIRQYKTASLLTPAFTALEVVMDVLIPYVTASLIEQGTHDQLLLQKGKYYQLYTGKEI